MDKHDKKSGSSYVEFALLTMVGTQFVVSLFIGFGVGYWLDSQFDTRPLFMLIFVVLGVIAGFLNVYRTIKRRTL